MKIAQVCALALLVVVGSAVAFADGIHDPRVIVGGGGGGGACEQCNPITGLNFSFTVPDNGTGKLFFTNESGKNWTSLALIEKGVPAADIQCHSSLFESCKAETLKNGSVEILLSGVVGGAGPLWKDRGIPNGSSFSISFSCVGQSCWPPGLQFNAHAGTRLLGTTPEPATVGLMVTGLAAMFSRRKYWRNRFRG